MSHEGMTLLERAQSADPEDWPSFSYTQMQVWDRCEYSWYLNYDQEWTRKVTNTSMNVGLITHRLLEIYYKGFMDRQPIEVITKNVDDELQRLVQVAMSDGSTHSLPEITRGGKIVKRYIREFAPRKDHGIKLLGVEQHFGVPLETPNGFHINLHGYVDLLTNESGKVWIYDHKTTANAKFWKPAEVLMDPQMTLYQYALQKIQVPVFGIKYNFLNTYEYKKEVSNTDQLFKREESYRSEKEINNFARQLLLEVEDLLKKASDPQHEYHRSLRRECERCQFQEPCLYALKGIDPTPVLVSKYQKKENSRPDVPGQNIKVML